jgi:hypothetical protein
MIKKQQIEHIPKITFSQDIKNITGAGNENFLKILAYYSFLNVLVQLQLLLGASSEQIQELLIVFYIKAV